MKRRTFTTLLSVIVMLCILCIWTAIVKKQYYLISFVMLLLGFLLMFYRIETKPFKGRELVFIAVLSSAGAVSRIPFTFFPGIQPASMLIMVTGWVLGPEIGWIVGANVAFVSNFFLGQGPWTPWQMLSWGLMGFTAGWFRGWLKRRSRKIFFGFLWGFLFGIIMNVWVILGLSYSVGMWGIVQVLLASLVFDSTHAISNVIFIYWMSPAIEKVLRRFKDKYGLLDWKRE